MTEHRPYNVLFLCTGNTARSILAEAHLNAAGGGKYRALSAGSHPKGTVNRFALEILQKHRIDTTGLRSKGWGEFAQPGARNSISSLPSAITPPARSARCGRGSR